MVKKRIFNSVYIKVIKIPKVFKTFSSNLFSTYDYFYLFSSNFFFKKKFNKFNVSVISNSGFIKVYGSNYAVFKTYITLIENILSYVYYKHKKVLVVHGLGFKYRIKNDTLYLILGFSHVVKVKIPSNISITFDKKSIILESHDAILLTNFIYNLKKIRPLDAYKAKGVRLKGEALVLKKGKQTTY